MSVKQLIPCIYLKNGSAVAGFKDDTLVSADPEKLALTYFESGADSIIVFDLSDDDASHDQAIDMIKLICVNAAIPVIGAGNVKRLEDVKKLIYAGCSSVALNFSKGSNIELAPEAAARFGKDRIFACIDKASEVSQNRSVIDENINRLILLNEHSIKEIFGENYSYIVMLPDVSLDKIIEMFKKEEITGMTGSAINSNHKAFEDIKALCIENGIDVNVFKPEVEWKDLKLNSDGMVPVIVQDCKTGEVLMLAYMNEEAYIKTLKSMRMTYFSRSRNELWIKGETSGHYQYLKELKADCDKDTLLAKVHQVGAACHTGSYSCFFNEIVKTDYDDSNPLKVFESVMDVIKDRKVNPKEGSYTNYLFDKGIDKILKKVGEEATEIVIAAKNPNPNEIKYEIADFLYHMMVLMAEKGISWEEITEELDKR
ncbi:MAG: bifunctional phosphoribosyl-AMP cyclohydrolase/phosphoribosyl-ATP diphosphatase HisIE [Lachnospiraceae bacterium]|nr:bifunctional phosphoribosyl-AMP cyclohydrolase/phosphoribosyl-ATP diphosphatase HisIE [Lachnospiraceae bacterium]